MNQQIKNKELIEVACYSMRGRQTGNCEETNDQDFLIVFSPVVGLLV